MSKSLAKKKADRKAKGKQYGTKTRSNGYTRQRDSGPPHLPKEDTPASMLVRQKVSHLVRIEREPWASKPDLRTPKESCTLTAHYSDGSIVEMDASVSYEKGEREAILEAVMRGEGTEEHVARAREFLYRRNKAVERAYAKFQHEMFHVCQNVNSL